MKAHTIFCLLASLFSLICNAAPSADNIFFYRANYFPGTPRLDLATLTSIEVMAGGGSTTHARTPSGKKVPLRGLLSHRCCNEEFSISEAFFSLTQNMYRGIFLYALLPFRSLKLKNIYHGAQCDDPFSLSSTCQQGMGDASFYLGWTLNYQETEILDFVDMTIKVGALTPTAPSSACFLSLGNDNHVGIPVTLDLAIGVYDWFTYGAHASVVPFLAKKRTILFCNDSQITQVYANVHHGLQWLAAGYLQADHFFRGFSLLLAYSYAKKYQDRIQSCITHSPASCAAPVGTCLIPAWSLQTVHFALEYDFTKQFATTGFRLGMFYNVNVAGKNVWTTGIGGGNLGVEARWSFD